MSTATAPVARRNTAAERVRQLAGAVTALEAHRDHLERLRDDADILKTSDVIIIDGEMGLIDALAARLDTSRQLLTALQEKPGNLSALNRLEDLVGHGGWEVLGTVENQLQGKKELLQRATAEVQERLGPWVDQRSEILTINDKLRQHNAVLPRDVAEGRDRLSSLVNAVEIALDAGQLLVAKGLLDELDSNPSPTGRATGVIPIPARAVRDRLAQELNTVKQHSGRVQLTVLRGPLDRDRFEYTLMLLTPGGDQHVGVNVQDTSTIVVEDRRYFLEVLHRVGGTAYRSLRGALKPSPGEDARTVVATRDARPVGPERTQELAADLRDLQEMGAILYKLLLPDRMKEELGQHPLAQLTITSNDLELPWELMFEGEPGQGGEFLALRRPVSRMPVGRSRGRRSPIVVDRTGARRVGLIASVGEPKLADARREVELIRDRLKSEWKDQVGIDMLISDTDEAPRGGQFRRLLLSGGYDIVHYAGHAAFDPAHPDQSGLLLDGGELCFAQKIQRLLQGHPLVFLNACETARLTASDDRPPPEGTYEGDPREGLASAFVYGGALACIGAMWPVSDAVAADFAVAFYGQVLEGQPLGRATLKARQDTAVAHADDPSWAAFVLYGDPSYQLAPLLHPTPP